MDRRTYIAAFIAILLLLFLGRKRILEIITKPSGFELGDGGDKEVELEGIKVTALPAYHPGPETWVQTTGLMCHCEASEYISPFVVREITIPPQPLPHFVYANQHEEIVAAPHRSYSDFTIDNSYTIWTRGTEQVYRGSDGRIFLKPKRNLFGFYVANVTDNPLFIGTDEYSMVGNAIEYGAITYDYSSVRNSALDIA